MTYKLVSLAWVVLTCGSLTVGGAQLPPPCTHVCDIHGGLSLTYCTQQFRHDPLSVRACCLSDKLCPETYCTDYGNVTIIGLHYNIFDIALDLDQFCDCAVVACVDSNGLNCEWCSPPSNLMVNTEKSDQNLNNPVL